MAIDLERVDRFLALLATAPGDDALRILFETFRAEYDVDVPDDPFGSAYRKVQFDLYERLHGKPYATSHERSPMDIEASAKQPFPYVHGSAGTVGDQFMGIGYLIKTMGLPRGAQVLEFGPGWGNTTLAMAKMGYGVTAVDIEQNFVDLIRLRASMEQIPNLVVRQGDFSLIESMGAKFDAVLFFECFHHCSDHLRLMAAFDKVVKPGGIVCFAAEPIVDDFPIPWGLRVDGQSLWAIRRNGWLELGFNTRYFEEAMRREGWWIERHVGSDCILANVIIARRLGDAVQRWDFSDGKLMSGVGVIVGSRVHSDGRLGYLVYGPYAQKGSGSYVARFHIIPTQDTAGFVRAEVASHGGMRMLAMQDIDLRADQTEVVMSFDLPVLVSDLELRLFCKETTTVAVEAVSVERIA